MSEELIVYTNPSWEPCRMVKEFLSHENVDFIERNVVEDIKARKELVKLKEEKNLSQINTPVIVRGEKIVIGYNREKINALIVSSKSKNV